MVVGLTWLAAVLGTENMYLRAQAPPPSPSTCEAWCPRKTCCSFCDDPACKGCGAVKKCGMTAPASSSGPASSKRKPDPHAAPGFQSGPDGFLYANGKRFHIKGINWWGSETANAVPGGLQRRTMDDLLDFISDQGFNAVRLLLNHHAVLVNSKVNQGAIWTAPRSSQRTLVHRRAIVATGAFNEGLNPELVDLRYRDMLELVVRPSLIQQSFTNI